MKEPASSQSGKPTREAQINLVLKREEKNLAEMIASKRGLKVSALVRLLILDEARRLNISEEDAERFMEERNRKLLLLIGKEPDANKSA